LKKTRVLIIDDSALMRAVLTEILSKDPATEVVGTASDPLIGWEKLRSLSPDVVTLDVEMPRMDGITFLDKLMRLHPVPVVMVSSLTEKGGETTLRALEHGAVDFVTKPKLDLRQGTTALAGEILSKVRAAAAARVKARASVVKPAVTAPPRAALTFRTTEKVIAIGASTGGTEAIRDVLEAMPADAPGTVIVQHMPEKFTSAFAARLNRVCKMEVREAQNGDRILPGVALIAPGAFHMEVMRSGVEFRVRVFTAPPVNGHRPSVDVLFESCAKHLGRNAVGVILTGMGKDGAKGLADMRTAQARTVAQDEATCVVFGMPKEAIALGGVEVVAPLHQIAEVVSRLTGR
jgi:two-component system chemotaxis response regulator CheB